MRILRLTARLPPFPGGLEIHVRELTLRQAEEGIAVDLVYGEGEVPARPGVTGHAAPADASRLPRWWPAQQRSARAAVRVGSGITGPVDLVHAHGDYAAAWAALRLAGRFRCPGVLTVHGGLSERIVHRAVSRLVFPRLTHLIAVSDDIAAQLRARGVAPERVSVISSGVHCHRFAPVDGPARAEIRRSFGATSEDLLVVTVGRLHPVKGLEHLVAAVPRVRGRVVGLRVVIAGDGPDGDKLRQLAAPHPEVALPGALGAGRVADLLRAADLFVLTSVDLGTQREGTPTSVLEAMSAALPVVATWTGGVPQLVRDGVNGALVPPADPAALADAIFHLAEDPRKREAIGRLNRESALSHDWAVIARRVREVYDQCVVRRPWSVVRGKKCTGPLPGTADGGRRTADGGP
jgi:glycosyltransferase involved in cell wall biosynthesis